jgi:hypothetical protein
MSAWAPCPRSIHLVSLSISSRLAIHLISPLSISSRPAHRVPRGRRMERWLSRLHAVFGHQLRHLVRTSLRLHNRWAIAPTVHLELTAHALLLQAHRCLSHSTPDPNSTEAFDACSECKRGTLMINGRCTESCERTCFAASVAARMLCSPSLAADRCFSDASHPG